MQYLDRKGNKLSFLSIKDYDSFEVQRKLHLYKTKENKT
jgi:translation elongation factor P/translation initiation factor 5A